MSLSSPCPRAGRTATCKVFQRRLVNKHRVPERVTKIWSLNFSPLKRGQGPIPVPHLMEPEQGDPCEHSHETLPEKGSPCLLPPRARRVEGHVCREDPGADRGASQGTLATRARWVAEAAHVTENQGWHRARPHSPDCPPCTTRRGTCAVSSKTLSSPARVCR